MKSVEKRLMLATGAAGLLVGITFCNSAHAVKEEGKKALSQAVQLPIQEPDPEQEDDLGTDPASARWHVCLDAGEQITVVDSCPTAQELFFNDKPGLREIYPVGGWLSEDEEADFLRCLGASRQEPDPELENVDNENHIEIEEPLDYRYGNQENLFQHTVGLSRSFPGCRKRPLRDITARVREREASRLRSVSIPR